MATNITEKYEQKKIQSCGGLKYFLLVIFFVSLLLLLPLPQGLSEEGRRAIVLVFGAVILWAREIIHPSLTALLLMLLFSLMKILPYQTAVAGLGTTTVWLMFGVFTISAAMQRTGLDRRLALYLLRVARGNSKTTLLMIVITTTIFIFLIPSTAGRAALLTPICLGMVKTMGLKPGSNIAKSMFLAISFTSLIGSLALMTGSASTVYAVGFFDTLVGHKWTYVSWIVTLLPSIFLINFLIWPILLKLFPPELSKIPGGMEFIEKELSSLGKIKRDEFKMFFLLFVMILLWVIEDLVQMSVSQSCLLIAIIIMLPGIGIISFKDAIKSIDWGIILLFGASLAMVEALVSTEAINWLAQAIFGHMDGLNHTLLGLIIMVILGIIRLGFPNLVSFIATTFSLIVTIAVSTGINPLWLGLIGIHSTILGIFLPTQSATHLTTYNAGFYSIKDMSRAGFFVAALIIIVVMFTSHFYWPLLGIRP